MALQRKWNEYEAVILLDGLFDVLSKKDTAWNISGRVSRDIRTMAVNNGEEIDDVFRNQIGVNNRMRSLQKALSGEKCSTKLFNDIADMYTDNRSEYETLLHDAKEMIKGKAKVSDPKGEFIEWLIRKTDKNKAAELEG